jgi:lipopolysaccharide/colanic/teichoic acid biosynthesis glycosyltransferase
MALAASLRLLDGNRSDSFRGVAMQFDEGSSSGWSADEVCVSVAPAPAAASVSPRQVRAAPRAPAPRARSAGTEAAIRLFDIVFAATFLLLALPMLIVLAVALQLDSPGKLFFVQPRIGRNGDLFRCLKFRTMCENAEEVLARHLESCPRARAEWDADFKLRQDPRVTRLGAFARKYSLDELPQLLNILKGDMSVVGPRPIVTSEIVKYGACFADYCAVKPGLTGLWQVSGRNDVSYARRVALDRYYVRRKSFVYDLGIVMMTVPAVLKARGSY